MKAAESTNVGLGSLAVFAKFVSMANFLGLRVLCKMNNLCGECERNC